MKARRNVLLVALLVGACSVLCFTNPAAAAIYTWDPSQTGSGSDGGGTWNLGTDWASSGGTGAWLDGSDAVFGVGTGTAGTVTIATGTMVQPNSITFNPALSGNYLITGGSINLPNATSMVITATNAGATISSAMVGSGSGGLTTSGNLTLNGNLSFAGGLTVNSGTLTLTGSNSFGGFYNSDPGKGAGNHTNGNPTVVNAGGVLSFSSSANLPQVNPSWPYQDSNLLQLNGGTLLDTGTGTISTLLQTSLSNNPTFDIQNPGADFIYNWGFSGGGTFFKTGSGALTIAELYQGGVNANVQQGTLVLAVPNTQAVSWVNGVSPGATLKLGATATNAEIWNGIQNMNGTFDLNGYSTGVAGGSGLTGTGTITNGALSPTSTLTFGFVNNGQTGGNSVFAGSIIDGTGKMALAVAYSTAQLTLTGTGNTYSGGTTISAGELQIGDGSTGPGSLPGNVLVSNTAAGALTFNTPPTMSVTASGNISGAGGLTKTGPGLLTLTGNNTYSGSTTLTTGELSAASTASLPGWNVPNMIDVAGNTVLAVQTSGGATAGWSNSQITTLLGNVAWANSTAALGIDTTNGSYTYTGSFSPSIGLAKLGPNALTLTGNINLAGALRLFQRRHGAGQPQRQHGRLYQRRHGAAQRQRHFRRQYHRRRNRRHLSSNGGTLSTGGGNGFASFVYSGSTYYTIGGLGSTLVVNGGTTTLSGTNSYAGVTYTCGGPGQNHCIITPTIVTNGGVLSVASLSNNLPQDPSNLRYQDNYPLQINGGTLLYTGSGADSTYLNTSLTNGMIEVTNPAANPTFNWSVTNSGGTVSVANGGNITFNDNVSNGTLFKTGSGTLTFTGNNTNNSLTVNVVQGTVVMAHNSSNGNHSADWADVSPGATLKFGTNTSYGNYQIDYGINNMNGTFDLNGVSEGFEALNGTGTIVNSNTSATSVVTFGSTPGSGTSVYSDTFAGSITNGAGGLGVLALSVSAYGSGSFTLTGTGNTYSGGTTIGNGVLNIGNGSNSPGSLPGNVLVSNTAAGALTFNTPAAMSITTSGNISGSGGLTKTGPGLLTLTGNNTYSGSTTLTMGELSAASTASLPGWNVPNMIDVAGNTVLAVQTSGGATAGWSNSQITTLLGSVAWANSTAALGIDTTNGNYAYTGSFSQSIGLGKLGTNTLTLTGSYTYPGPTVVSGGTLQLGDGTVPNDVVLSTSNMINNAAVLYNVGGSLTPSYSMSGVGSLTKAGSGTLTFNLANTYSGNTLVSQGTLLVGNNQALQNSTFDTTGTGSLAFSSFTSTPIFGGLTGPNSLSLPSTVTSLTLNLGSGVTQSYSGILGTYNTFGGLTLNISGSGTQILSGANNSIGTISTTLSSGQLGIGNAGRWARGFSPSAAGPSTIPPAAL